MTRCRTIQPNITKICAADFNRKITLQYPVSVPNNNPNQNAGSSFQDIKTCWAMVKTIVNADFVNDTNVNQSVTADFYIRFDPNLVLSKSLYILFEGVKYKVVNIDNVDLRNELTRIRAIERGDQNIAVNLR
jgi:SPP1 family predicted phage head-tail adaptor